MNVLELLGLRRRSDQDKFSTPINEHIYLPLHGKLFSRRDRILPRGHLPKLPHIAPRTPRRYVPPVEQTVRPRSR